MTASKIKSIRKSLHLTQREFSLLIGVSVRTVQGWEQGAKPSMLAIKEIRRHER